MKKILLTTVLTAASATAFASAPGGPNCGWGNLLFEGQSGTPTHVIAYTTNGTSGNASFGMTSGTNGCQTSQALTYSGKKMVNLSFIMDEFSEDAARGQGEALNAVAVMMGVEPQDRDHFAAITHQNFNTIFPDENVRAEQVLASLVNVMQQDNQLAKYVAA